MRVNAFLNNMYIARLAVSTCLETLSSFFYKFICKLNNCLVLAVASYFVDRHNGRINLLMLLCAREVKFRKCRTITYRQVGEKKTSVFISLQEIYDYFSLKKLCCFNL